MPRPQNARTESMFVVTISGIPGYAEYWQTCEGLEDEADSGDTYSDGLNRTLKNLPGPRKVANCTLTKAYDHVADRAVMSWYDVWCEGDVPPVTVTVQPVRYCNEAPELDGEPIVLQGCRPTKLTLPNIDKKSSNIAMLGLDLTVERIQFPR